MFVPCPAVPRLASFIYTSYFYYQKSPKQPSKAFQLDIAKVCKLFYTVFANANKINEIIVYKRFTNTENWVFIGYTTGKMGDFWADSPAGKSKIRRSQWWGLVVLRAAACRPDEPYEPWAAAFLLRGDLHSPWGILILNSLPRNRSDCR